MPKIKQPGCEEDLNKLMTIYNLSTHVVFIDKSTAPQFSDLKEKCIFDQINKPGQRLSENLQCLSQKKQ